MLTGCGKDETQSAIPVSTPDPQATKAAATGPALSEKLTFGQLALDSAVKRVRSPQGPVYLHFTYTDQNGNVYKCELPEAMSKGSYLPDEWIRIFGAYRLPQVVKTKAPPANPLSKSVSDFPFISPRPASETSDSSGSSPGSMEPAPPPPPAPAGSPGSTAGGRTMPDYD